MELSEINIAQELEDLISGKDFGTEHFIPFVHRRLRRDGLVPVKCNCFIKESNEGVPGCGDCDGQGFLWDEAIIPGFMYFLTTKSLVAGYTYKNESGRSEQSTVGFITKPEHPIYKGDRLSVPLLTQSGTFVYPVIIEEEYFCITYKKYRLDNGKNEYCFSTLSRIK